MNELIPAFVLHARDYRDTSLLIEIFTPDQGRFTAVAKGARRVQRGSSQRAILQPLQPLWIECSGRGELKTLRSAEVRAPMIALRGHALYSALYINELLCRLLHRDDPSPQLFDDYSITLAQLASTVPLDITLRHFELRLLDELGYGFSLTEEGESGLPIQPVRWYAFDIRRGLTPVAGVDADRMWSAGNYAGADLLAFAQGDYNDDARRALKRLCRIALRTHLGDKPLQSRALLSTKSPSQAD